MKDKFKLHIASPFITLFITSTLTVSTVIASATSETNIPVSRRSDSGAFCGKPCATSIIDPPVAELPAVYDGPIVYYQITSEDRHVLECVVQGEAGGESLEGKMWVATCLLNAMKREGGASADFVRVQYQYSGWDENVSDDSIRAVSRVFDDGDITHDSVLWFYAPKYCTSLWHESQEFVAEVGGHRFFCQKGEE